MSETCPGCKEPVRFYHVKVVWMRDVPLLRSTWHVGCFLAVFEKQTEAHLADVRASLSFIERKLEVERGERDAAREVERKVPRRP